MAAPSVMKGRKVADVHADYDAFVEKFAAKKTTDDCYTPPAVYDVILSYVDEQIAPLEGRRVLRPFYPGGDYENENYQPGDVVIDNQPFSMTAKIVDFYLDRGIDFFLFAPALTVGSAARNRPGLTIVIANAKIEYLNGAKVQTAFLTNMERKHRIIMNGDLGKAIYDVQNRSKEPKKVNVYPDGYLPISKLNCITVPGVDVKIPFEETVFSEKVGGVSIFGGGYFVTERAAAERAAAERAAAERAAAERAAAERAVYYTPVHLAKHEIEILKKLNEKVYVK